MRLNEMSADELAERFEYLDELRDSGETNMFGAGPYVARKFGDDRDTARAIVKAWMDGPDVHTTTPRERADTFVASGAFLRAARAM